MCVGVTIQDQVLSRFHLDYKYTQRECIENVVRGAVVCV